MTRLIGFCLLMVSFVVDAYDFSLGRIDIPQEFEGPVVKTPNPAAQSIAFKKPHENSDKGTLLQISTFTPAKGIPALSHEQLVNYSVQYLQQFLKGVERQRSNFEQSDVEIITISGVPAARVKWQGDAFGETLNGVMYCLLHGGSILSFHTQDFAEYQNKFVDVAVKAIENVQLTPPE